MVRHLIEASRIICRSNKYLSNGNQELEVTTMEMFVVIGDWLMKDQNEYNKFCNAMSGYQTWQTPILRFQSLEFGIS